MRGVREILVPVLCPLGRSESGRDGPSCPVEVVVQHQDGAGVPVHIVAARLGDTPTTVLSAYAHLLPQSDEIAAERVAAALAA